MIRYVFREDEPIRIKAAGKADPQVIGESLEQIRVAAGGELEPKAVVDAARDAAHPLHPHFEWDNARAAEAFRIDQARSIIRIVRVVDEDASEGTSRAFISIHGSDGTSYRTVGEVKRSWELQNALLAQALKDLESFENRYRSLKEICKIVAEAREKISDRIQRNEKESRPTV